MMKPFKNYNETQVLTEKKRLPVDAYICEIKKAEAIDGEYPKLVISFDICEGDYKDFYATEYKTSTIDDKKWKGNIRLSIPLDDGSEKDEFTKKLFKTGINAIEDSNDGYHWDWNEIALRGKKVGILFRNKQWSYNGKTGFYTEPFRLLSTDDVNEGNYKIPSDKLLDNAPIMSMETAKAEFEEISDDDLPF